MKPWLKWTAIAVAVALIGAGIARTLSARKASQAAASSAAAGNTTQAQSAIELAVTDVVSVKTRELAQGVAISGALKAVNSAVIKARVAGELQGLTVREGDLVKAGQVVARVDPSEYESRARQAQLQADAAKAQIDIAQRQYDNNRALVDQGFISKTALDTSSSNLVATQATHKAALAAVEVSRKAIEDTVLRSPLSGVVAQRLAQTGERVGIDARILEVVDLSRLEVEVALSAADSVGVKIGQLAALQIEGGSQAVAGRVVRINPSAQAGSRSVLAYLSIDKPEGLRQGLFAQGTLGTQVTKSLVVPVTAVRTDRPEPYVQTVENGLIAHRSVKVSIRGEAEGEPMAAITGVTENTVVTRGAIGTLLVGTTVKFTAKP